MGAFLKENSSAREKLPKYRREGTRHAHRCTCSGADRSRCWLSSRWRAKLIHCRPGRCFPSSRIACHPGTEGPR